MLPLFMRKPTWTPWGALVGVGGQDRRLETAVADLVVYRGDHDGVDQGGARAALRIQAEELHAVHSGRNRETRRLVNTVRGPGGRDQPDLSTVDQNLDFLVQRLTVGPLGSQDGDAVRAGDQIDGLADAARSLDEGHLAAVGGEGIAEGEAVAVAGDARRCRKLPGRAGGRELVGVRAQGRCLEAAVIHGVGREHHLVDEGRIVAALGIQAEELDGMRAGGYRKRRRLVVAIQGVDGIDDGFLHAIDQDLDFLITGLVDRTLGG
jgi:hypothetical protein